MRHRIAFQQQEHQQDSETGDDVVVWVDVVLADGTSLASVPAEVLTGPGREFQASAATQGEVVARINLRWFPGLQQTWRVLWEGQTFNISSIETDITAREEWRLRCESGVTDGR